MISSLTLYYKRLRLGPAILFSFLVLTGCLPEEVIRPDVFENDPLPVLPSLLCTPFIEAGYTERTSYFPGDTMKVFFQSSEQISLCRLTIFSVNGDSVFSTASAVPTAPKVRGDASENGYDFPAAVEFAAPDLKSGVYLIERRIPFIVKATEPVDLMIVYPSNTANAYALSGGKNLYSPQGRPMAVSFQRPIPLEPFSEVCLKWFTTLADFSMSYLADSDLDDFQNISHAKVLVIPGHSEYWTRQARRNFDDFVDSGGHALVLSGNTMWWQVRYSQDNSKLICYKDVDRDPESDPLLKTIEWGSPLLEYSILSSIGAHFPLGGYGLRADQGWNGFKVVQPASPLFEGLDLKKGDKISIPSSEYDGAPIYGYDEEGYPIIDNSFLGFEKIELLGFDKGFRVTETTATFIVFKKNPTSGIVMNTSTTDWCSSNGMGGVSGNTIRKITYNALNKLVNDAPVFSQ